MKCQHGVRAGGVTAMCRADADYACVASWDRPLDKFYVCAEHRPPDGYYASIYYVGSGATSSRVVPIEAALVARSKRTAR